MEDKPTTQAGRDVPRSRTPRTAFGTPDQPASPSKPAERAPRRAKAAPPVTFQVPVNKAESDSGTGSSSPDATIGPTPSEAPPGSPAKPAERRSEPARDPRGTPARTTSAPASAESAPPAKRPAKAAKATPAKKAKPVPSQLVTSEVADAAAKAPRAKKATKATRPAPAVEGKPRAKATKAKGRPRTVEPEQVDAVPAQAAADATPPAKAMPAAADPIEGARPADADPAVEIGADDPAPAQPIADATPPAKAAPAPDGEVQRRPGALAKLAADPGHAPELLALTAVQTIGPRAAEWVKRTREAYPAATDAGMARLAVREFTRLGSGSSIVGAMAGAYAPAALVATSALTQARLILHVAAAYGLDPADEARAADLLILTRVHSSRDDAEAALAGAKQGNRHAVPGAARRLGRMAAGQAAGWAVVKLANRYFPGTSLLVAALASRTAAKSMADRAITYYSQDSHALGSSV